MSDAYFYCDHCGIELFDDEAAAIPAGWTNGEGREVVTCPECRNQVVGIERNRDGLGGEG